MNEAGIIFDCDGTLLDSMALWQNVEHRLALKAGVVLNKQQTDAISAMTVPEVCRFFHDEFGLASSAGAVYEMVDDTMMRFYAEQVQERPGAVAFVRAVADSGVRCSVASSSPHRYLEAGLARCGILDVMDGVFSVDDIGSSKRERAIYDAAREAMGTDPARTWGMDDSLYAVRALSSFGYRTIALYDCDRSGAFDELAHVADVTVHGFDELDPVLISAH